MRGLTVALGSSAVAGRGGSPRTGDQQEAFSQYVDHRAEGAVSRALADVLGSVLAYGQAPAARAVETVLCHVLSPEVLWTQ